MAIPSEVRISLAASPAPIPHQLRPSSLVTTTSLHSTKAPSPPPSELSSSSSDSVNNNLSSRPYSRNASSMQVFSPITQSGTCSPTLYSISGDEMSSDGMDFKSSSRYSIPTPSSHRFTSIVSHSAHTRQVRRRPAKDENSSDDDGDCNSAISNIVEAAKNRSRRIESEQKRRDELRDGYCRLKDALPVTNQKSSKPALLDRATSYITYLETTTAQMRSRLQQAEAEVQRLRMVNEALMLGVANQRRTPAVIS